MECRPAKAGEEVRRANLAGSDQNLAKNVRTGVDFGGERASKYVRTPANLFPRFRGSLECMGAYKAEPIDTWMVCEYLLRSPHDTQREIR